MAEVRELIAKLESELAAMRVALSQANARAEAAESHLRDLIAELAAATPSAAPPPAERASRWQRFVRRWKAVTKASAEYNGTLPERGGQG
jgi:hypothetical protein